MRELILKEIIRYIEEHGYCPTIREIGANLGISSTATVHKCIEELIRRGKLDTDCGSGSPRALRVTGYVFVEKEKTLQRIVELEHQVKLLKKELERRNRQDR